MKHYWGFIGAAYAVVFTGLIFFYFSSRRAFKKIKHQLGVLKK